MSKITTPLLYAGIIGAAVGDIVPTAADALYFKLERGLRDKWKRGEITPAQYWEKTALYYYTLNPLYWLIVLGITMSIKGDANKMKVVAGIVGAGAVIGVLYGNIKKDELDIELQNAKPNK